MQNSRPKEIKMYRINNIEQLTPELIRRIVLKFQQNDLPRLDKLKNYYLNKTAILLRTQSDASKPNNKIVNPYAQYITDTLTGYFMGEPVSYQSNDDIEALKMIFEYNDEQDENTELAKSASIFGTAWELLYVDEAGDIRFCDIDTREVIPIYSDTVADELIAVIRYRKEYDVIQDKEVCYLDVYSSDRIVYYKADVTVSTLDFLNEQTHSFGCVPFVEYKNNEDRTGDFEGVMSLIDAYDIMQSDELNDFEYFCDAYLALYGYTADSDDVAQMKANRVLLMDEGTKAEWLVKSGDSAGIETIKKRIEEDIHKFSKTPDANDDSFGSNTSGVAMKYKLLGTENLGSLKERKFKKGLEERIYIISQYLKLVSQLSFDPLAVDIIFTRNLPVNEDDLATMISSLNGIVSKRTLVAQLPFVEDPDQEIEQLNKENESNIFYNRFTQEEEEEE